MPAPLLSPESPAASPLPTEQDIVAAPQSPPEKSESTASVPDEVLEIPAIAGLLHGAPPAIYAERTRKDPEIQTVIKNIKPLEEAGFGIYNSADGKLAVFYNSAYVNQDELAKADKAGNLTEVVPSFDSVQGQLNAAISGTPPAAGAALPGAPMVNSAAGAPPSSKTQTSLATKRANNLQVGSPTSGPAPGAGRILNNILKPTI